jgi:hypothetical protein
VDGTPATEPVDGAAATEPAAADDHPPA